MAVRCLFSTRLNTNLGSVDGSPIACRKTTGKQADFVQRCSSIYLGQGVLRHNSVFCKGAVPEEVMDPFSFASESAGLVRQQVLWFSEAVGSICVSCSSRKVHVRCVHVRIVDSLACLGKGVGENKLTVISGSSWSQDSSRSCILHTEEVERE